MSGYKFFSGAPIIFPANTQTVTAGAVTIPVSSRVNEVTVIATTAITIAVTGAVDKQLCEVCILDGGSAETLSWVNTENSTLTAPTGSNGSTTLPLSTLWQFNGATSKWRYAGSF